LCAIQSEHQHPLVDVLSDPSGHGDIEVGDEGVRGAWDTFCAAPRLHLGSDIRDLSMEPTDG
jgi:hypothetical protein